MNALRFDAQAALNLRFPVRDQQLVSVQAASGKAGVLQGLDYRQQAVVAYALPVANSNWIVITKMDEAEVYAPLRERLWQTLAFYGMLIVVCGAGLLLIWRQRSLEVYRNRLETAESLREKDERYRSFIELTGQLGWVTNSQGEVVEDLPAFRNYTGQTYEEIQGSAWLNAIHPDDRAKVFDVWQDAVKHQQKYEVEYRIRRADGVYGDFIAIGVPMLGDDGQVREWVGTCIDITARKQAENQVTRQAAILSTLLNSPQETVALLDLDGTVVIINLNGAKRFGMSPEEMQGKNIYALMPEPVSSERRKMIETVMQTGEPAHFEDQRHGMYFVNSVYAVNDTQSGELFGVAIFAIEITKRKQVENALRDSESRFRVIFERSTLGKSLTAPNGKLLKINQAFADMLGYTLEEMQEINFAQITYPEDIAESRECIRCLVADERSTYRMEKRYIHKDGSLVWGDVSTTLLRDDSGVPLYFITSIVNITKRKQAEEKLQQTLVELARSNKELEQFAYVASHDLQEPLRMVTSYMQLIERRYKDKLDADADEFIGFAVDGANRMKRLINDLLTYSRVGTRGKELMLTDTQAIVTRVLADLQFAIEDTGASITIERLPPVMADEGQLAQLFQNLLGNAIKFHKKDVPPVVHVACHTDLPIPKATNGKRHMVTFSVRDNGIGFDAQFYERIFVIFERLHGKQEYTGTGIGLAVCKKIVERHGGQIWVESKPDEGSTFYFTLQGA